MAESDDELEGATPTDHDRAAILARRQRFVALALSGLATTACTDKQPPKPDGDSKGAASSGESNEPPPQPCLSAPQPPPQPDPPPQVCLKIAQPEPEPEPEETQVPEPAPQPCLSKPRPCLRQAPPKPCLKMPAPE